MPEGPSIVILREQLEPFVVQCIADGSSHLDKSHLPISASRRRIVDIVVSICDRRQSSAVQGLSLIFDGENEMSRSRAATSEARSMA